MTRSMSQPASAIKLAGKIQQKYGVGKEEAERQVDEWAKDLKER